MRARINQIEITTFDAAAIDKLLITTQGNRFVVGRKKANNYKGKGTTMK